MRGYVFMLESVLAVILLVGFVLYLSHTRAAHGDTPHPDISGILPELEREGILRSHVYAGNITGLNEEIVIPGYNHTIRVCDASVCAGGMPSGDNVWVSSYILAGMNSYHPMEVILYAW